MIMKLLWFTNIADFQKGNARHTLNLSVTYSVESVNFQLMPEHIAVNEALLLWKGQLAFRQYIKFKRSCFGIKLFVTCPSSDCLSGYTLNFSIYYGRHISIVISNMSKVVVSKRIKYISSGFVQSVLDQRRHIIGTVACN